MVTLLPWTSIEVGDLDIFAPAAPCLLVHTSYFDGEPESSVTYFWQDPTTGFINHEVLLLKPVGFDEALTWAQEQAAEKKVERIHVRHARSAKGRGKRAKKLRAVAKGGRKKRRGVTMQAGRKTGTRKRGR